jgi:hypothetical protein
MPLVEKALRAYIKVIGDKVYLRLEKYLTTNAPISEALETTRTTVHLDKDFLESEQLKVAQSLFEGSLLLE